jgi:peptidoglycan/LPS O-acetylase OafA/YrhL
MPGRNGGGAVAGRAMPMASLDHCESLSGRRGGLPWYDRLTGRGGGAEIALQGPNRDKIRGVDELRGWAAMLVLFYHSMHSGSAAVGVPTVAISPFSVLLYEGHVGVALFMVLSGFILANGTFGKDISYAGFLRNRVLRIFPLMTVALMFSLAAVRDLDLGKAIAPFMLLANTKAAFIEPSGIIATIWTVSVEFQFYLIAPFLFLFVDRRGFSFLLPSILLFWLLRMILLFPLSGDPTELYRISYFTIVGRINQFMIGSGLAYLFDTRWLDLGGNRRSARIWLALSGVAALAILTILNHSGGMYKWQSWRYIYPELEGLIAATFIGAYLIGRPLHGWRLGEWMSRIGIISFSMYIFHFAIQRQFWTLVYPQHFNGMLTGWIGVFMTTILISIPIIGLSWLSYLCVEKPFNDMRGKYLLPRAIPAANDDAAVVPSEKSLWARHQKAL